MSSAGLFGSGLIFNDPFFIASLGWCLLLLHLLFFRLGPPHLDRRVFHLFASPLSPMQYYISGTIVFLVIEMLAQFAYYRYVNKNGGGAGSLAFLFVIAILNAARNSLSFFLLLIVSMGLSVVTQSLGSVMNKVRMLTAFHFVFGGEWRVLWKWVGVDEEKVLYAVGTVEVELDVSVVGLIGASTDRPRPECFLDHRPRPHLPSRSEPHKLPHVDHHQSKR